MLLMLQFHKCPPFFTPLNTKHIHLYILTQLQERSFYSIEYLSRLNIHM